MATITGTLGNDTLAGTTGADTLIGLAGNDTYTVNHCDDVVVEGPGAGTDTVNSSVTFVLGAEVENLTLTGTVAIDGTGNSNNNKLIGNGADNRITADLGNDTVSGGAGNDVLVLGAALTNLDRIDGGIGTDRLILDGSYNLALDAATVINVEAFQLIDGHSYNLTLNNATNAAGLTVDGSVLTGANTLVLNGAAETTAALTALGGEGNDTVTGGAGKDTISGGAGGDSLTGGAGIDTVSYASSLSGVTVDLTNNSNNTTGDAQGDSLTGFENVIGSDFSDSITGNAQANSLVGGAGDDTLVAGAGTDTLLAGDGNDTLNLADNLTTVDRVDGGDGNDTLKLSGSAYAAGFTFGANITGIENIVLAAGNNYTLTLSNATNNGGLIVDAGDLLSPNRLILSGAAELESALTVIGGGGNDSVSAGAGADTLSGGTGSDTLLGGAGNDVFDMGAGLNALDRIDGGVGTDTLQLAGDYSAGVTLGATTVTNVESFVFAAGSDYNLALNAATNSVGLKIDGSALGGGDNLTIDGSLETTSAFNFIGGAGNDKFVGGNGADTFTGGLGADTFTGGLGLDTVTYASGGAVTVDLATNANGGAAAGDKLSGIETVIGSDLGDSIHGDANANTIKAGLGDDLLGGGAGGNDTLFGEDGDDTFDMLAALTAVDKLDGGDGFDTLELTGNYAAGLVFGATTAINFEQIIVDAGSNYNLTLSDAVSSTDLIVDGGALVGNTLKLTATAEKNNLFVFGGTGNDTLIGGAGSDLLDGGAGNDSLSGGAGANVFVGGTGADTMTGGIGIDTADYTGSAAVTVDLNNVGAQVSGGDANGDRLSAIENVIGTGSGDKITGNSLANTLFGMGGVDTLIGGSGNDTLVGGTGGDQLTGGAGIDMASYADSLSAVTVNLSLTTAQVSGGDASGDVLSADVEGVIGSSLGDALISDVSSDILSGEGGNDTLIAGGGNDTLSGGAGADQLLMGNFLNSLDKIDGGDDFDIVQINGNYSAGVSLSATNFSNIELVRLIDSGFNYRLTVNTGTAAVGYTIDGSDLVGNTLFVSASGSAGISIIGGDLADTLTGGSGGDVFHGGAGGDILTGGIGNDMVDYSGSTAVTVNLSLTTAQVSGGDAGGDRLSGIEHAIGSAFDDKLTGTTAVNQLDGSGGNDTLIGGAGADTLIGGIGLDTADYAASTAAVIIDLTDSGGQTGGHAEGDILVDIENVTGSNFNDRLVGDDEANKLIGNAGNDTLIGGLGGDTLDGGAGTGDLAVYTGSDTGVTVDLNLAGPQVSTGHASGDVLSGIEHLIGSTKDDSLTGDKNSNSLTGDAGDDTLVGGDGGTDTLRGGAGDDELKLGAFLAATDQIDGGADSDKAILDGDYSAGVVFGATTMVNVEEIELVGGNDYKLTLNNATNASGLTVDARDLGIGDVLILNGAAETTAALTAFGGADKDTIVGGAGADTIEGGGSGDALTGGTGIDTASYAGSASGVTVNLLTNVNSGGDAQGDSLSGFENIIGSDSDDSLTGNALANLIDGGAGGDTINGGDGGDTIDGGAGGDIINGGAGGDTIDGGAGGDTINGGGGFDTVTYAASTGAVTVALGTSNNFGGDAEGDSLSFVGNAIGSGKDDSITGTIFANQLSGGAGNDTLAGEAGNDSLTGGDGNDRLVAGDGIDTLIGGAGNDTFLLGAFLTATDQIDGGADSDKAILDGNNYAAGVVFGATTMVNVEEIELVGGNDYKLTLNNATNASGLTVDARDLGIGDVLILNGAAETTAALTAFGGADKDTIVGGAGADTIEGGGSGDALTGGTGIDTASYAGSALGVTVNLSLTGAQGGAGDSKGDVLSGIENVIGSDNDDKLIGNTGANTLEGGKGADTLDGAGGFDVASYAGSGLAVVVDLGNNANNTGGDALGDVLNNIEGVTGSNHDDSLTGNGSANLLSGGAGNDTLVAECGNDTVNGNAGNDQIVLGAEFTALDRIDGGGDDDVLLLDGNYAAGVVFGATTLVNVETIELAAGNSYKFTLSDAADTGGGLSIDGSALGKNETLYVSGVLETSNGLQIGGGAGNDTLLGGSNGDDLSGGDGNDALTGNGGADDLDGGAGNDSLTGGDGSDRLTAGAGIDTLLGGADGDTFDLGANLTSADRIDGGTETDEVTLAGDYSGGLVLGASTIVNVEQITLTDGFSYKLTLDNATNAAGLIVDAGDLTLGNTLDLDGSRETAGALTATGGAGDDRIIGGAGADMISGGGGGDTLAGGAGVDTLSYETSTGAVTVNLVTNANAGGDAAGDQLSGFENIIGSAFSDNLTGDAGNNVLIGGLGADSLNGGLGTDTVDYSGSGDGILVDLESGFGFGGDAAGDSLTGIENLVGTGDDDALFGNSSANRLDGGGGDDLLSGGSGADTLLGGDGHDLLHGGAGADSMDGGALRDEVTYYDSNAGVTVNLSLTTPQVSGGDASGDILFSIEDVEGSKFNDRLTGTEIKNYIEGGDGADTLDGAGGFDFALYNFSDAAVTVNLNLAGAQTSQGDAAGDVLVNIEGLSGSMFDDRLIGNASANSLYGEIGNDTLTGGAGSDLFGWDTIHDGLDVITDFQVGQVSLGGDVLHIGNVIEGFSGGSDINDFLRIVLSGGQTVLQLDFDGKDNGVNFVGLAVLNGVSSGLSVDTLFANGQIDTQPVTD